MEVITKEYKVFDFKELSDEVKQEIIDKHYQYEDYPFLTDDLIEELDYQDKYFDDINLQYSLSWSQGDGLSFSGQFNLKKFLDKGYSKKLSNWKKRAILEYIYKIHSTGNVRHYCFASKDDIEFEYNYTDKELKRLEILIDDIVEEIKEYYINLCFKLEKYGYSILEYRMDFGEFEEMADSNGYKYLEFGKIF